MKHDVRAVANVFYQLARPDGRILIAADMQRLCRLADELCRRELNEPLVADHIYNGEFAALPSAFGEGADAPIRGRENTLTPPIEEDSPAWKVIRAAYMQFDYEERNT